MANAWNEERKQRQRELIKTWRPWEKSTGPKSDAGKKIVSRNAYRGAIWLQMRMMETATTHLIRGMKKAGTWPPKPSQ